MLLGSILKSAEPLSQVTFVHDYVQLRFQETCLSLYSRLVISTNGVTLGRSDRGFCDALVALIGQSAMSVDYQAKDHLRIAFSTGAILSASLKAIDASGEELFQLQGPGTTLIVEQVA